MKNIDVKDLPERLARALADQADRMRALVAKRAQAEEGDVPDLKTSDLGVKGPLRRHDIYEDRV